MKDSREYLAEAVASFAPGEWAYLLAWPWVLAAAVAVAVTGGADASEGAAAAKVAAAGVVFIALVGAPLIGAPLAKATFAGDALRGLDPAARARRAGTLAALTAAVASPAFVACTVGAPSTSGTVVVGSVLCGVAMYVFAQATAVSAAWYPAVAVLWLGVPPFTFYLLIDFIGIDRRAHEVSWLLYLGPASGAVKALMGSAGAWRGLVPAALLPVLVGAGLSLLPVLPHRSEGTLER